MSGPLGFGAGGGGGDAVREVIAGSGITTSGTATSITVVNDGVRSLSGSGISVSSATGAVTITAPTVSGGTGISVSGSGTTSLTVSATGVNSVTAGTGISVSGTTALTVSATGVQSLTAGTGISVSGTTTPTITNSGVTSIVAGTGITVSGATGAVTVNAPGFATPGSSAIGDTAAAGTATTVSRSDHVHGREAAGTPGASAVGDTASAGVASTVARSDHRHSREAFGTPVNIDASLTSLSAGSLTTVARADHVHTVSKVPVLIASTTLGSNTATVTLSSIPQTFTNLLLQIVGSTTSGGSTTYENICAQYSGVTSSSYYRYADSATGAFSYLCPMNSANSNWASAPHVFQTWIANYSSTTLKKGDYSMCYVTLAAGNALNFITWANVFNSTTAITSIALYPTGGQSFVAGSKFALYGYP